MPDDRTPSALDLGLYAREKPRRWVTGVEIVALILTILWIGGVVFVFRGGDADVNAAGDATGGLLGVLTVLMPIALIWVAATAARTAMGLREEAARLQASIDAMRAAYVEQQQSAALDIQPEVVAKLDALLAAGRAAETRLATFASHRSDPGAGDLAEPDLLHPHSPQPGLDLSAPPDKDPISIDDFIRAMNFPETEHDKDGFRALRNALDDPRTERLIRAGQDVLTLLSQDGIYMDDLAPDRARPELWRRFAQGERGRAVAPLGGIHDRTSLALTAGRMKNDPVFRDAAHHFLRQFDRTFMAFERSADDADVVALTNTRTARAFMLLGRVAGTFD